MQQCEAPTAQAGYAATLFVHHFFGHRFFHDLLDLLEERFRFELVQKFVMDIIRDNNGHKLTNSWPADK